MIALQQAILPEPSLLDIFPWLVTSTMEDDSLAFDWSLTWLMLDPLGYLFEVGNTLDPQEYWYEDDPFATALFIAQSHFPDIYADFSQWQWDMSPKQFRYKVERTVANMSPDPESYLADELNYFWCPVQALGADYQLEDWVERWKGGLDWDDILAIFGISPNDRAYTDNQAYSGKNGRSLSRWKSCDQLVGSLESKGTSVYDNVAMLLRWLFVGTNNTLMDWSEDSLAENNMTMGWDEYHFACQIQEQANEYYGMALAGIEALNAEPMLLHALDCNYHTLYRLFEAQPTEEFLDGITNPQQLIQWPEYRAEGTTGLTKAQSDYSNIRFWRDSAHTDHPLRR